MNIIQRHKHAQSTAKVIEKLGKKILDSVIIFEYEGGISISELRKDWTPIVNTSSHFNAFRLIYEDAYIQVLGVKARKGFEMDYHSHRTQNLESEVIITLEGAIEHQPEGKRGVRVYRSKEVSIVDAKLNHRFRVIEDFEGVLIFSRPGGLSVEKTDFSWWKNWLSKHKK